MIMPNQTQSSYPTLLSFTYRSEQPCAPPAVEHPLAQLEHKIFHSMEYEFVKTRSLGRAEDWLIRTPL